jgi:hypothetical protein
MAQPLVLTKSLSASSSNFLGSFSSAAPALYSSGAVASVGTSSGATATPLDTQRRITVWSTAADQSSLLITLTGLSDGGRPVVETITGSTAANTATRTTQQDFRSITSISFSSAPIEGAIHIATSSRGGTPWIAADTWRNPFNLSAAITMTATGNTMSANFECTLEDITQATVPSPKFLSSASSIAVPYFPTPFIPQIAGSTFISTAIDSITMGSLTAPISAWRVTLTSSSSTAGMMRAIGLQAG